MSEPSTTLTDPQREEIAADVHNIVHARLREITGTKPQLEEVGQIMACAFGDICGLLAMNGLGAKIPELNARAEQSAKSIMRALAESSCEGGA